MHFFAGSILLLCGKQLRAHEEMCSDQIAGARKNQIAGARKTSNTPLHEEHWSYVKDAGQKKWNKEKRELESNFGWRCKYILQFLKLSHECF